MLLRQWGKRDSILFGEASGLRLPSLLYGFVSYLSLHFLSVLMLKMNKQYLYLFYKKIYHDFGIKSNGDINPKQKIISIDS